MLQLHVVDDYRRGDENHPEVVTFVLKYKRDTIGTQYRDGIQSGYNIEMGYNRDTKKIDFASNLYFG